MAPPLSSYFDLLSFDIQLKIYRAKHELEYKQTLDMITKLVYAKACPICSHVSFNMGLGVALSPVCDMRLRNGLLSPISCNNNITIDLKLFSRRCYFYASRETVDQINIMLDLELTMYRKRRTNSYEIPFQYDCVNVKFKQKKK